MALGRSSKTLNHTVLEDEFRMPTIGRVHAHSKAGKTSVAQHAHSAAM